MLFGIKYETNKRGLKIANMTLKRFDSGIMFTGKNTGVFFTNPIVALKVSRQLNEANNHLTYKVYKLSKNAEKQIDDTAIVSTYEEYKILTEERWASAIKRLDDLNKKSSSKTQDPLDDDKAL
jgi:hypothetical protein